MDSKQIFVEAVEYNRNSIISRRPYTRRHFCRCISSVMGILFGRFLTSGGMKHTAGFFLSLLISPARRKQNIPELDSLVQGIIW